MKESKEVRALEGHKDVSNPVTTSEDRRNQFGRGAIPAGGATPNMWPLPKQTGFHSLKPALTQSPRHSVLGRQC